MTERRRWITLCVLTLIGSAAWFALHWPHSSFWYDETTVGYVIAQSWPSVWQWATMIDLTSQLPLYLILIKLWMLPFAGASIAVTEFALRTSSVLLAFLSVAGMLALARRAAGKLGGFAAAVILVTLPAFVYITFEVRVYGFAFAAAVWSYAALWELLVRSAAQKIDQRLWRAFAVYVLATTAALYGHYTALLVFPVHALSFAAVIAHRLIRRDSLVSWRRPLWLGFSAAGIVGIAYGAWLPMLLRSNQLTHLYFEGQLTFEQARTIMLDFLESGQDAIGAAGQTVNNALIIGFVACALLWLIFRRQVGALLLASAAALIPFGLLTWIVLQRAKLTGRYVWGMWIGVVLIGALGVAALRLPPRARFMRWLPPLIGLALISTVPWALGIPDVTHHSNFRDAFAYLREHWQANDLLVLRDGTLFTAAEFYQSPQPYIGLPADKITDVTHVLHAADAADVLRSQPDTIRRVWLLAWQGDVMDPQAITAGLLETIGTQHSVEVAFGDVDLAYFTLNRPLNALHVPDVRDAAMFPLPDGLSLQTTELLTPTTVSAGDRVTIHGWWVRRDDADNDLRVSIRLIGADGKTYSQVDQPPAGWIFYSSRWTPGKLVMGDYAVIISDAVPKGSAQIELVLYNSKNVFSPATVQVGSVSVR